MKVSYNWLQSYFEKKLPVPKKLAEAFTFHFSEVESIEKVNDDTVFDLKILPDRACYALSHRGVAREVNAILDIPIREPVFPALSENKKVIADIGIRNSELCTKFVARRIENVSVGDSPRWLKERLASVGQRSINAIVDLTNYVMFDIGRPLHAFDADKVKGKLVVRAAKKGEVVTTLDNKRVELQHGELVMADDEGPLGLAGIKGGKRAEVDVNTKNIILEAANWNPVYVRKTAIATGIQTDASKRFENTISPMLGEEGIAQVTYYIQEIASTSDTRLGKEVILSFEKQVQTVIKTSAAMMSENLGISVSTKKACELLGRLRIVTKAEGSTIIATVPLDRLDLTMPEDLAEEVGRLLGYDSIPAISPPHAKTAVSTPKQFYWEWKIREFLLRKGFSEIMTSSFSEKGQVAIEKPLAEDKKFARANLRDSFAKALTMNFLHKPLFGVEEIKMFEIGKVFSRTQEHTALAIGYAGPKKKREEVLKNIIKELGDYLGGDLEGEVKEGIFECELDAIIAKLPEPKNWDIQIPPIQGEHFEQFSLYPFIVRDVALFVPSGTSPDKILECIRKETGKLAVRSSQFDAFKKNGKQSFAFRIVFQSFEKTLTDEEANAMMEKIYEALRKKFGTEIR